MLLYLGLSSSLHSFKRSALFHWSTAAVTRQDMPQCVNKEDRKLVNMAVNNTGFKMHSTGLLELKDTQN